MVLVVVYGLGHDDSALEGCFTEWTPSLQKYTKLIDGHIWLIARTVYNTTILQCVAEEDLLRNELTQQ